MPTTTATHLYHEIHQQPAVLAALLRSGAQEVARLAAAMQDRGVTHVVIAARGTSDNAGRYAKYVFGARNGLVVSLATPSLYTHYDRKPTFGQALVLGISQSGQSPDIVAVLAEARRQGALTGVITNDPGSPLAAVGDVVVDLAAGEERAVAATKTYSASLMVVAMLSAALDHDDATQSGLQAVPDAVDATLTQHDAIAQLTPRFRYMARAVIIGRGFNYATAFEMALKVKELAYVPVEPYSSADFLHGPLALLEAGFPVFVVAPSGALDGEMAEFIKRIDGYQPETVCISDSAALISLSKFGITLPHPLPEWLSPIAAIVPGQLFALHLAAVRGYDVDYPRSIAKVTETH